MPVESTQSISIGAAPAQAGIIWFFRGAAASHPDLTLARQRAVSKSAPRAKSRAEAESWQDVDRSLFDRLRALRLEIARSRGVPPYVIFHDATLREMARLRPKSFGALLAVKGVGTRKADDLGEMFINLIRSHA